MGLCAQDMDSWISKVTGFRRNLAAHSSRLISFCLVLLLTQVTSPQVWSHILWDVTRHSSSWLTRQWPIVDIVRVHSLLRIIRVIEWFPLLYLLQCLPAHSLMVFCCCSWSSRAAVVSYATVSSRHKLHNLTSGADWRMAYSGVLLL